MNKEEFVNRINESIQNSPREKVRARFLRENHHEIIEETWEWLSEITPEKQEKWLSNIENKFSIKPGVTEEDTEIFELRLLIIYIFPNRNKAFTPVSYGLRVQNFANKMYRWFEYEKSRSLLFFYDHSNNLSTSADFDKLKTYIIKARSFNLDFYCQEFFHSSLYSDYAKLFEEWRESYEAIKIYKQWIRQTKSRRR